VGDCGNLNESFHSEHACACGEARASMFVLHFTQTHQQLSTIICHHHLSSAIAIRRSEPGTRMTCDLALRGNVDSSSAAACPVVLFVLSVLCRGHSTLHTHTPPPRTRTPQELLAAPACACACHCWQHPHVCVCRVTAGSTRVRLRVSQRALVVLTRSGSASALGAEVCTVEVEALSEEGHAQRLPQALALLHCTQ
jgi:hypothetical protein